MLMSCARRYSHNAGLRCSQRLLRRLGQPDPPARLLHDSPPVPTAGRHVAAVAKENHWLSRLAPSLNRRRDGDGAAVKISSVELARARNGDALRAERFGPALTPVLRRRPAKLAAAAHLADRRRLPQARLRRRPGGPPLVALGPAADLHLRPGGDRPPSPPAAASER